MDVVSFEEDRVLEVRRWNGDNEVLGVFNFSDREMQPIQSIPFGVWRKRLDSQATRWMGKGAPVPDVIDTETVGALMLPPQAAVVFEREVAR